jgi:hypothetical protein
MTDLRTAAQRLLDAIDRALPEAPLCSAFDVVADTADDLRDALAYREDKAQAAFEHWLVEKLLTVTAAQAAHADATCKQDLQVEPCNKSCAPGYCYCEPIIKPEIKVDNTEPGQTNPWRDAVDHELSTLHMVASDDPRESIRRLIDWHCAVQIDPLVSSAAQELIERGKREALEQTEQDAVVGTKTWHEDSKIVQQNIYASEFYKPAQPRHEWQTLSDEEIYPLLVSSAAQELIERGRREALEPEQAEPVAWRTFDGEGGYDYRTYDDNENYRDEWDRRNPNHKGWVEPLYTHPPRREWRGLKEWEINDGLDQLPTEDVCSWSFRQGVYFAEKALKERNV